MNDKINTVKLPDWSTFDATDFNTYSELYVRNEEPLRALQLEIPVTIITPEGNKIGNIGDWLIELHDGTFAIGYDQLFKLRYKKAK